MNAKRKPLLWALIAAAAVLVTLQLFSAASLRRQMEASLSSAAGRTVVIRSARLLFPFGVRLAGIQVPRLPGEERPPYSVERIDVRLLFVSFLEAQPGVELELQGPRLVLDWKPEVAGLVSWDEIWGELKTAAATPVPIRRLKISEGELAWRDGGVTPGVNWVLRSIQAEVRTDPQGREATFRVSGTLDDGSEGTDPGRLQASGSVIESGPIQSELSLNHNAIGRLDSYLRPVLGTAPDRGRAQLVSRVTIHQGVLMCRNDVTAEKVHFPTDEPTTLGPDGNRLVELLADPEGKIAFGFIVTGPLGGALDWSDLAAGAMQEALRQSLARGIQRVLSATEQPPVEKILRERLDSLGR